MHSRRPGLVLFSGNGNKNLAEAISKKINRETLLLFWQYTIKAFDELDMVSNQDISLEMFLITNLLLFEILTCLQPLICTPASSFLQHHNAIR